MQTNFVGCWRSPAGF